MSYCGQAMHEAFSERIKKWRGPLRQKQAADILEVRLGTYRSWENGKRTPKKFAMAEVERRMDKAAMDGLTK